MGERLSGHIEESIREICRAHEAHLLEILLRGSPQRRIIEIYADSESGITLDTCGIISKEINDLLEREQPFSGSWRLDVSSPGVDRPLEHSWQYQKNTGRLLLVELTDGARHTGRLTEVHPDSIVLESVGSKQKQSMSFPFNVIQRATVQLEW